MVSKRSRGGFILERMASGNNSWYAYIPGGFPKQATGEEFRTVDNIGIYERYKLFILKSNKGLHTSREEVN